MQSTTQGLRSWLRQHSLTLELLALGTALTGVGIWIIWPLTPERWFDLMTSLGAGALTVALMNILSWGARETVRPED